MNGERTMIREELKEIAGKYGIDTDLVDMVHQHMMEMNRKNQEKRVAEGRIGKFYPSSVGACRRKIAYQMLGYPGKPIPGKNLLIMENGTSFHNRMEHIFGEMGIMIAPELKLVHEELRISGRSDAIVWNWFKKEEVENDEVITLRDIEDKVVYEGPQSDVLIVELKSINNKNWDKLPKTLPKMEHRMQLQLYMYLTGIRQGVVYYENKDNQDQKYFYVAYNPEMVEKIINDIRYVIKHIDENKLPERDYPPVSFQCTYCDYKDMCRPSSSGLSLDDILDAI
jgi:CRISPR/Cas system-associated exonuclease Cas4 (RecB family)